LIDIWIWIDIWIDMIDVDVGQRLARFAIMYCAPTTWWESFLSSSWQSSTTSRSFDHVDGAYMYN
jgi:hypothetical protein